MGVRRSLCKSCHSEYRRTKYAQDSQTEIVNARNWATKNADKVKEYRRRSFQKNKDKLNAKQKDRYHNLSKEQKREVLLKKKYKLSLEEFKNLILLQNSRCLICEVVFSSDKLVVDHCHTSGTVRGLLCNNCNMALGLIHENLRTAEGLVKFIRSLV